MKHALLHPILLLAGLALMARPALKAQEAKPAPTETKATPKALPMKDAKAPEAPAKAGKTSAKKKAAPSPPNYNLGEEPPAKFVPRPPKPKLGVKKKTVKIPASQVLNLNAASREELKQLPGVTDEYADKIIAGRPYGSKTGLLLNNVIPSTVYYLIKDRVGAGPATPKP
jgi:DNA uptake protein ComE-like DNA-binding protein